MKRHETPWYCKVCLSSSLPFMHINEDGDFLAALSELWTNDVASAESIGRLAEASFNFLEINEDTNSPFFDVDPDIQILNQLYGKNGLLNCDYYLEHTFRNKIKSMKIPEEAFSMIHQNIRSWNMNGLNFYAYLKTLEHDFHIIALTETMLNKESAGTMSMPGYEPEHAYRTERGGGGASLLIKEGIEYKLRDDLYRMEESIECVFIEIFRASLPNAETNTIIGSVYRPPNTNLISFQSHLETILETISNEKKTCRLAGDFNLDVLKAESNPATARFVETLFSHSFIPMINKPTRSADTSHTCIDHIHINNITDKTETLQGIFYTGITDHFPIFLIDLTSKTKPTDPEKPTLRRIYSQKANEKFSKLLDDKNWDHVLNTEDAQLSFTFFHNDFTEIYNKAYPIRLIKSGYRTRKEWLPNGIKKSIEHKNKLFIQSKRHPDPEKIREYKEYRNKLTSIIRKAEISHYKSLFNEHKNNIRKSWDIIKEIINKKSSRKCQSQFKVNNKLTSDSEKIANGFNKYFVEVGPTLAQKCPQTNEPPTKWMKPPIPESIFLLPVMQDEIIKLFSSLKNCGSGWDDLKTIPVKDNILHFVTPLTHVMNASIMQGVVPSQLKIARVIPIFKCDNPELFSNYRPVSVLPLFSKILEKLMFKRLINFVNDKNLIFDYQFGFREGYSTGLAMTHLVDSLVTSLDEQNVVLGLFLDFSKAFDTVDHTILFQKLEHYGIRGIALNWFKSYLQIENNMLNLMEPSQIKNTLPVGSHKEVCWGHYCFYFI